MGQMTRVDRTMSASSGEGALFLPRRLGPNGEGGRRRMATAGRGARPPAPSFPRGEAEWGRWPSQDCDGRNGSETSVTGREAKPILRKVRPPPSPPAPPEVLPPFAPRLRGGGEGEQRGQASPVAQRAHTPVTTRSISSAAKPCPTAKCSLICPTRSPSWWSTVPQIRHTR